MLITKIAKPSTAFIVPEKSDALMKSTLNCTKFVGNDYLPIYSCHMASEAGLLGICSFVLTMTNILCIISELNLHEAQPPTRVSSLVMAMVILRVKEVVPIVRDDEIGMLQFVLIVPQGFILSQLNFGMTTFASFVVKTKPSSVVMSTISLIFGRP